jgi:tryptophan synthase alpha chain
MNDKLNKTFVRLRQDNRRALIPFLTAEFPTPARFAAAVDAICESGADILEIGFPHSDPLADGPVIQHSSHRAISGGFTVSRGFAAIRSIASRHTLPIVVMCYANLICKAGPAQFVKSCRDCGVSGLIVPDMTVEESGQLRSLCARSKIAFINLVTPTTPPKRSAAIAASGSGFLYLVSVVGTTGARVRFNSAIKHTVRQLKSQTSLPICIGFGISTPEMAAEAARCSDGVIIGSKVIQLIDADDGDDHFTHLKTFLVEVATRLGDIR